MAGRSVNKVILVGNLGKDAETRFTPSGVSVSSFTLATTRRVKEGEQWRDETDWHNVTLWRNEGVAQYLTKGKQVYVEGRLHTRKYQDKEGRDVYRTEVVAEEIMLLGGRGEASSSSGGGADYSQEPVSAPRSARTAGAPRSTTAPSPDPFDQGISDDDVPF